MLKTNHYLQKYLTSAVVVTGLFLSPMLASSVFAHGAPEAETTQANEAEAETTQTTETQASTTTQTSQIDYFSKGDQGEAVKDLQETLQTKGYTANPDGMFGPETRQAVIGFQKNNNLQVDGFAGPETKQALSLNPSTDNTGTEADQAMTISEKPETQTKGVSNEASNEAAASSDVVSVAKSLIGSPYVPGGTTPAGFDSSGFINYVFEQAGVSLDRTHAAMWSNNGEFVDYPSVGDVVFFEGTYKDGVSHSGIYIGNNQIVHAGTSATGVEVTDLGYDYWQSRNIGAKSF